MNQDNSNNISNAKTAQQNVTHGLSLSGTVVDRTRQMIPRDNPTTEIATYTVRDGSNLKFYVDDYAPVGYHDVGSDVCFPVYIKAYNRRNSDPSYTLNIQKTGVVRGEHF